MQHLSSFLKSTILFLIFLLILLSLISYTPSDISSIVYPPNSPAQNLVGIGGAYLGFMLFFLFGYAAYFLPFCLFFLGLDRLKVIRFSGLGTSKTINIIASLIFLAFLSFFLALFSDAGNDVFKSSGLLGYFLSGFFKKYLGIHGSFIISFLLMAVSATLFCGFFFVDFFKLIKKLFINLINFIKSCLEKREINKNKVIKIIDKSKERLRPKKKDFGEIKPEIKVYTPKMDLDQKTLSRKDSFASSVVSPINKDAIKKKVEQIESQDGKAFDSLTYKIPKPDILKVPPFPDQTKVQEDIKPNIKNLESTLSNFGVEAKVVSVQRGPVVTMYELSPQAGTKIQKISSLADEIALAMKSSSVRIVAPIPGRGTIGVEIPNLEKNIVFLREVLEEKTFSKATSKLTLAVGKDVSGSPVIADLKDMPHLLIAGATGTGKTVSVNSLISSILFKAKPDEVKFILVDPKMVELAPFAGIPHLIHPIISESKKAFSALNWAVEEMERRYKLLAEEGARNIDAYNSRGKKFPYIIIVVDELADLMIVARDKIETSIQRLAQLSRAVGIHLILATQRPSVDVITGIIKANFPARISFKVSSRVDSRTVLDAGGADKLLGKGDLLFLKPGAIKLIRAQGSFIEDEDMETLTNFIRSQGKPIYEEAISESEKRNNIDIGSDELLEDAVKMVLRTRQASASLLQRRLRVGYTRAARLLDLMENEGVVGPFCGSKAREILVEPEAYLVQKGWV